MQDVHPLYDDSILLKIWINIIIIIIIMIV
jgi:hypothetical protein